MAAWFVDPFIVTAKCSEWFGSPWLENQYWIFRVPEFLCVNVDLNFPPMTFAPRRTHIRINMQHWAAIIFCTRSVGNAKLKHATPQQRSANVNDNQKWFNRKPKENAIYVCSFMSLPTAKIEPKPVIYTVANVSKCTVQVPIILNIKNCCLHICTLRTVASA